MHTFGPIFLFGEKCGLVTNKCNPGVGAVPVDVIMIVLQIGPTYQTCIYFAEKLMVLRCYDHNLNTDRKRRL